MLIEGLRNAGWSLDAVKKSLENLKDKQLSNDSKT